MTIASEIRKLISLRGTYAIAIGMVVLAAAGTWSTLAAADPADLDRPLEALPVFAILPILLGMLVLVLGIRSITDEYRHGTIVATLTITPRRGAILAAKLIVGVVVGAALGFVAQAVVLGVAAASLASDGIAISSAWDVVGLLGRFTVAAGLWTVLGLAIGTIVRHQLAATVGGLIWFMIADALAGAAMGGLARYLPGHAVRALTELPTDGMLAPWTGAAVFAVYAAATAIVAAVAFRRRDVD